MSVIGELKQAAAAFAKEDGSEFDQLNEFWQREYYALAKYERSIKEQQAQSEAMQGQAANNVVGITGDVE